MLSLPADALPSEAADIQGIASMEACFGGMLFTLATGWLVDHFSYRPVFYAAGVMPLVCAALLWTLVPRVDRISLGRVTKSVSSG